MPYSCDGNLVVFDEYVSVEDICPPVLENYEGGEMA